MRFCRVSRIRKCLRRWLFFWGWSTRCRNHAAVGILRPLLRAHVGRENLPLLDVGCGGDGLAAFLPRVSVVGVDVEKPEDISANLQFRHGSITELPFDNQSFSVVSCIDVLEHLPEELRFRSVRELIRVGRCTVLIAFPHAAAAVACDSRFRRECERCNRPAPAWLNEHQAQPYPSPDIVRGFALTACRELGRSAEISISYCEPVWVLQMVRWALCRSKVLYVLISLTFGIASSWIVDRRPEKNYRAIMQIQLRGEDSPEDVLRTP